MAFTVLLSTSCNKDDDEPKKEIIVSAEDLQATIKSDLAQGETVGTVVGSSNDGSVNFNIQSQTPQGVLAIGTTDGVLTVADANLLSTLGDTDIVLVVNVTKGEVSKTANVTITVEEAAVCTTANAAAFSGDIFTDASSEDARTISAMGDDCGLLSVTGVDPFYFLTGDPTDPNTILCDTQISITAQLTPDASNDAGTVTITEQDYGCAADIMAKINGTGTYDVTSGIINLTLTFTDDLGTFESDVIINLENPDTNDSMDTDGDGVLDPDDEDANDPCLPVQSQGYVGYDETNTTWATADCDGDGTSNQDEVANFTDPYVDDSVSCTSTVDTSVWAGNLESEEDLGGFINEGSGTGITGCGTLTFAGDILGIFCDDSPSVTFAFTPESDGATNGTVEVVSQSFACFDGIDADTIEGTGTYDETTGVIVFDYSFYDSDFDETITGTVTITKAD